MRHTPIWPRRILGFLCLTLPWSLQAQQQAAAPGSDAVTATLDLAEKFVPGQSLLWSPTGQAVWDEMKAYHKVPAIELEPHTPVADVLNRFRWDPATTLPDGTLIFSGEDSARRREEIRDILRRRIGPQAAAMIGPYLPPGELGAGVTRLKTALFVSCLSHSPRFPVTFARSQHWFRLSDGREVSVQGLGCAGTAAAGYEEAVKVLADDLQGACVLKLALSGVGNEKAGFILVATRPNQKEGSLGQTIEWMKEALKSPAPADKSVEVNGRWWRWRNELTARDEFWMPFLKTTLCCEYGELANKTYLRQRLPGGVETFWMIREAKQLLSFRLNEQGTMAQAVFVVPTDFLSACGEGGLAKTPTPQELPLLPRKFLFKTPFVVTLWKAGAEWPYLACWADSEGLLSK